LQALLGQQRVEATPDIARQIVSLLLDQNGWEQIEGFHFALSAKSLSAPVL
jgi:hypothetical protein